ncbi:hypothetical protein P3339_14595 [Microbulbifer sp. MLAF003]|uniref:hypothetical protein n=1 Tax=Microbulbifer sp. MLAF003 TaxID=3032582 RepID=UPI0024ACA506|nr:hypothetical protein [Microbulbifer sp. MLAF003]WHI49696.1 hypothetical protein P3339_14595 [Microbulbifer sp. MLAF003]
MYQLFIANKNYSSWSLRPWLLMHHLEIPFNEQLATFEEGEAGRNSIVFPLLDWCPV